MMLQEHFLRQALAEHFDDLTGFSIEIDHLNGVNTVNGIALPIKYSKKHVASIEMLAGEKKYRYAFSGFISTQGGRQELLAPFVGSDSFLESSGYGRDPTTKYEFNSAYYGLLKSTLYALCPHQLDWPGPENTRWTYRVIEACFSRAMPVIFRRAPCGPGFLQSITVAWDDETHAPAPLQDLLTSNFTKALHYWTLQPHEIAALKR